MVYGIVFVYSVLLTYLAEKYVKVNQISGVKRYSLFIIPFSGMFLVSALRYGIGTDYFYTYIPRFNEIASGSRTYYEFGFYYLNKLIAFFTQNAHWVIVITSAIIIYSFLFSIIRLSESMTWGLVYFFVTQTFFISLNNLRQVMVSILVMCAFPLLVSKKKHYYVIYTAIVIGLAFFHQSAVVYLILLPAVLIRWDYKKVLILSTSCILVMSLFSQPIRNILSLIDRMKYYYSEGMYIENNIAVKDILLYILLLFFFLYIDNAKKGIRRTAMAKYNNLFIFCQMITVVLCFTNNLIPAVYRVIRLFVIFQFVSIPNFCLQIENKKIRYAFLGGIAIIMGILTIYYVVFCGGEGVWPYRSIFSK